MIGIFVGQDMCQQRFGGHAAINRAVRCGRLNDGALAGAAPVARPTDHAHPQLSRDVIQHLCPIFADRPLPFEHRRVQPRMLKFAQSGCTDTDEHEIYRR